MKEKGNCIVYFEKKLKMKYGRRQYKALSHNSLLNEEELVCFLSIRKFN